MRSATSGTSIIHTPVVSQLNHGSVQISEAHSFIYTIVITILQLVGK